MTRLLEEPGKQQDNPSVWSALGNLPMPLVKDFRDTLHDFWGQTVSPVFRLISQTVAILWQQALLPAARNWLVVSRKRLNDSISGKKQGEKEVKQLIVADSIRLRKIHGALGERWTSETTERPIRLNSGKQNPWIAAEKRTVVLTPQSGKASGRLPVIKEEIRGLDDIFTSPVQGSFLDVINKHGQTGKNGAGPTPRKQFSKTSAMQNFEPVSIETAELSKMASLAQTQAVLREEAAKLGNRVRIIAESTNDWFTRQESDSTELSGRVEEKAPAPYHSYAMEEAPVFVPAAPKAQLEDLTEAPTVVPLKPSIDLPKPAKITQAIAKPSAIPVESKRSLAPVRSKPPELSYELAEDLNGLGYMAQNNRILSNSISNLVDSYFQQASLEEESSYY